jgi:glucuronoxylan 4-O-methyltransferase
MRKKDIYFIKDKYGIQLESEQLLLIAGVLRKKPCNFLVFGVGNDTKFWREINKKGRTVFIEDNKDWFQKIKKICPAMEAYLVNYPTKITQWKLLLNKPRKLELNLPKQIADIKWDVILVDAPCGAYEYFLKEYGIEPPGRMVSIYMASKLIKKDGHVFVHDCHREVERVYSDRYLLKENLVKEVGTLRHYRIS